MTDEDAKRLADVAALMTEIEALKRERYVLTVERDAAHSAIRERALGRCSAGWTIPDGTYGSLTYTTVGAGGGNGGGSAPLAEPTDPPEQQAVPSTPIAIAVFVLVAVLAWAALQWL